MNSPHTVSPRRNCCHRCCRIWVASADWGRKCSCGCPRAPSRVVPISVRKLLLTSIRCSFRSNSTTMWERSSAAWRAADTGMFGRFLGSGRGPRRTIERKRSDDSEQQPTVPMPQNTVVFRSLVWPPSTACTSTAADLVRRRFCSSCQYFQGGPDRQHALSSTPAIHSSAIVRAAWLSSSRKAGCAIAINACARSRRLFPRNCATPYSLTT